MEKEENISEIVHQAQCGDTNAFGVLYERFFSPVYRYIYLRVHNAPEAEDIAQTVFLKAFQNIGHYEQRGNPFLAYLFASARHAIIDQYRKIKPEPLEEVKAELASGVSVHENIQVREEFDHVIKSLARLSDDQQVVLSLRFIEEWAVDEVAQHLGKTPEAVRQIQSRGLRRLREMASSDSFSPLPSTPESHGHAHTIETI